MEQKVDLIFQALQLWLDITGVDPLSKKFTLQDWSYRSICEELKQTQEYDESGITTAMFLKSCIRQFSQEKSFTVEDFLNNPKVVEEFTAKFKKAYDMLSDKSIQSKVDEFISALTKSLQSYGALNKDVKEMLTDETAMAVIRRNAIRSFNNLKEYQFLRGDSTNDHPVYIVNVLQAWNINSLLEIAGKFHNNSIAICLIRNEEEPQHSYFVFLVKNNANIWILTDKVIGSFPEQHRIRRRQDREFDKKVSSNHFPYHILDFEISEKDKAVFFKKPTALAKRHENLIPVKDITHLFPDEIIWITLMFDLIKGKFFKGKYQSPALAYTAEMIKTPAMLSSSESVSHLPIKNYKPLEMAPLSVEKVTSDNFNTKYWGGITTRANKWLEDRYLPQLQNQDKVKETLNLVGYDSENLRDKDNEETKKALGLEYEGLSPLPLLKMNPEEFGTPKELEKSRVWYARKNFVQQIQKLTDEEFVKRKDEVLAWFQARLEANIPNLLQSIAKGSMTVDVPFEIKGFCRHEKHTTYNILDIVKTENSYGSMADFNFCSKDSGRFRYCYLTGGPTAIVGMFRPRIAAHLAAMANCSILELPDVLQNWIDEKPYYGNSILDNVDPLEWDLDDPWTEKLKFTVKIMLSKRAIKKLKKEIGENNVK